MSTTAEKIAVMQAYERGEKIELCRRATSPERWEPAPYPFWDWFTSDYRVAPKPRLVWVKFDNHGTPAIAIGYEPANADFIKMREVTDV